MTRRPAGGSTWCGQACVDRNRPETVDRAGGRTCPALSVPGPNVTRMANPSPRGPLPHGSWPTPITSELVVRAAARLGEVVVDGDDVWWSESRPSEGGRSVLVRRSADGTVTDVLPRPVERSHPGARVRRRRLDGVGRDAVVHRVHRPAAVPAASRAADAGAVTPEPPVPRRCPARRPRRPSRRRLLAVRETHPTEHGVRGGRRQRDRPDRVPTARRPSWSAGRTSCPTRAWPRTASRWPGCSGTTRTCRGTPPSSSSAPRTAPTTSGRRTRRVRRPAGLGRRPRRCGGSATGRTSGRCTAVVRTATSSSSSTWAATSPARSGCSGSAASRCSPTAGSSSPTAAPAPTGSPSWNRDGALRELDLPYAAFRYVTAQGTAVVCVAGGPAAEPVVLRVDVDGGEPGDAPARRGTSAWIRRGSPAPST